MPRAGTRPCDDVGGHLRAGIGLVPAQGSRSRERTACRRTAATAWAYSLAGQKREESGVNTSSPRTSVPAWSRPSSNFVSARMIRALPRAGRRTRRARAKPPRPRPPAPRRRARRRPRASMFTSWPEAAFVAGVTIGSGSRLDSTRPRAARARRRLRWRDSPSSRIRTDSRERPLPPAASRGVGTRASGRRPGARAGGSGRCRGSGRTRTPTGR